MMSLQNLIQYQLSEGLTKQELAHDIGVPTFTIHGILKGRDPKTPDIWKKLARYFHLDVNLLRFNKLGLVPSQRNTDVAGRQNRYRKVAILSWTQARDVVEHQDSFSFLVDGQEVVDTELPGARVFAMHVEDDSMEPLFHEQEIIFVAPDLPPQAGNYVVVLDQMAGADRGCLRQLKKSQERIVLHPLNSAFKDAYLMSHQEIVGRVVRLRMNL